MQGLGMERGTQIKIMIVGDNQFNIEEVVRLSSSPIMVIHQAMDSEWAIEQFDRTPCHVLILCHSQISDAENFYNSFIMFSDKAMETPHQTLLLCDGKDSAKANTICSKQAMDDYVIYKPLYDVQRVRFSIGLAMDRLESQNYKSIIEERLTNMVGNIGQIRSDLSDQIDKVSHCQQVMSTQENSSEEILEKGIFRIKEKLERLHGDGIININDQEKFTDEYNKIKTECIEENKTLLDENYDLSWIENMKSNFSGVRDNAESILKKEATEESKNPLKILIVEDEAVNQKMMEMMLIREGFTVKVAGDGISAINIAENWLPSLILMDIKMPKMNGLKVTQKLKSNRKFKETRIIMLTGHSEQAVVKECLKAGASDFIVKPAQKDELLDRISGYYPQKSAI
jgi:CheY-like chemotaxis protein